MKKRTIAGIFALTAFASANATAANETGDIAGVAGVAAATGCSVSLNASYSKGSTVSFTIDSTGGSFVNYHATVIANIPVTNTLKKYQKIVVKQTESTGVSGIGMEFSVPGWGNIGGTGWVIAIVKESGTQHVCYDTLVIN